MAASCSSELEQACGAIKDSTHILSQTIGGATDSNTELATSLINLSTTPTSVSCSTTSSPAVSIGGAPSNSILESTLTDGENVHLLLHNSTIGSTLPQSRLDLHVGDVNAVQTNGTIPNDNSQTFSECNVSEDMSSTLNGSDTTGVAPADVSTPLSLPQTSLLFVNLPGATQCVLIDPSRSQPLFRFRDLTQNAHASLISATQEHLVRKYVNKPATPTVTERVYKCDECGRNFKSHSHFRYHLEAHKGNKVLKCHVDGCNRTFAWPAHLKYHVRTHQNDRPYACTTPHCQKQFYTVQSLKVHMRSHTGHKPFGCERCEKSFTTAGNLKNHVRTHTGEKPYACDFGECRLRFAEKSSLRKHKLTHTGDKPYECEICGKLFSQCGSRNAHKKRQHGLSLHKSLGLSKSDEHLALNGSEILSVQQEAEMHLKDMNLHQQEEENPSCSSEITVKDDVRCTDNITLSHTILEVPTDLGQDHHHKSSGSDTPTSDTNVVVLSQSQHALSIGSQFPPDPQTSTEDIVYTNALLQTGLEHHSAHDIPVSDDIEVGPGFQDSDIHHTHIVVGDHTDHKTIIGLEPLMESDTF